MNGAILNERTRTYSAILDDVLYELSMNMRHITGTYLQYADCKLVSIQHGSARLHRRDAEVPILPCWPDRLRTHLPLQKTCSLLRRATQAARFRGSRVHRIFFCPGYKLRLLLHTRSVRSCMYIPLPAITGSYVRAQRTLTLVEYKRT